MDRLLKRLFRLLTLTREVFVLAAWKEQIGNKNNSFKEMKTYFIATQTTYMRVYCPDCCGKCSVVQVPSSWPPKEDLPSFMVDSERPPKPREPRPKPDTFLVCHNNECEPIQINDDEDVRLYRVNEHKVLTKISELRGIKD